MPELYMTFTPKIYFPNSYAYGDIAIGILFAVYSTALPDINIET